MFASYRQFDDIEDVNNPIVKDDSMITHHTNTHTCTRTFFSSFLCGFCSHPFARNRFFLLFPSYLSTHIVIAWLLTHSALSHTRSHEVQIFHSVGIICNIIHSHWLHSLALSHVICYWYGLKKIISKAYFWPDFFSRIVGRRYFLLRPMLYALYVYVSLLFDTLKKMDYYYHHYYIYYMK